jgi:preprotein translocase subunit YajC
MGGFGFFLIIIAFFFLYFVLVRPQKRRQLQQQQMLNAVKVGDEIVTAGGMYGEIREVRDDDVIVRIAPDLDVRVARRAIAGVTTPEPEELEEPESTGPTPGT